LKRAIEALGKDGILTANEQQKVVTAAAKPVDNALSDEQKNPPS
jgi:hypothetical protein